MKFPGKLIKVPLVMTLGQIRFYIFSKLEMMGYNQVKIENIDLLIDYNGSPASISNFFPDAQSLDKFSLKDLVDAGAWTHSIVKFNHKVSSNWQQLFRNENDLQDFYSGKGFSGLNTGPKLAQDNKFFWHHGRYDIVRLKIYFEVN